MSLSVRFKNDYFNYLISIILPAFIAGISVPVFKHLLGAKGYGNFSIYFNAVLIGTAISTGWITQSIYRFYPVSANKPLFAKLSIVILGFTQLVFFLPVLIFAWYREQDLILGILIWAALFISSMQFSYLVIAQSSFLSKKTIYSETIRAVSYIVTAVILLLTVPAEYLYGLFIAVILSYSLSVIYLRKQIHQFFIQNKSEAILEHDYKRLAKKFFKYGMPLSMWFFFAYLLSYIDKVLMLRNLGAQDQGNYQAIFDFLSRGIAVLISPVIISMFPLLTIAYEKREITEIKKLLKKIILLEAGGLVLAAILYEWFGAKLLFLILKVPDTGAYRAMGLVVIAGTFIWQIAMVIQQQYVLRMKSFFLLCMIITTFTSQLLFYWIFRAWGNVLLYPLGYLFSSLMYLFLVSFAQLPSVFKSLFVPVKNLFYNIKNS